MRHWQLTGPDGATQFIVTKQKNNPGDEGYPALDGYAWERLERQPDPDEDVIDGKITVNPERKAKGERRAQFAKLSRDELVDAIMVLVDDRIATALAVSKN